MNTTQQPTTDEPTEVQYKVRVRYRGQVRAHHVWASSPNEAANIACPVDCGGSVASISLVK
jgi:hypothetical protein